MLRLELNFLNLEQRRVRLSLTNAKEALTAEEVQTAMESIIGENVFDFVSIHSARYVRTTVDDIAVEG